MFLTTILFPSSSCLPITIISGRRPIITRNMHVCHRPHDDHPSIMGPMLKSWRGEYVVVTLSALFLLIYYYTTRCTIGVAIMMIHLFTLLFIAVARINLMRSITLPLCYHTCDSVVVTLRLSIKVLNKGPYLVGVFTTRLIHAL